jgi:hypothetical protein
MHEAAATITFLSPGLRFFHQGQSRGFRKRISPHLGRGPDEPTNVELAKFYDRLLTVLRRPAVREGQWQLLECGPAWDGNWTSDCFLAFAWQGPTDDRLLVTVNYSDHQSQCYVRLPFADLHECDWRLRDQLAEFAYDRSGSDLQMNGLFLDLAPWQSHVFELRRR